MNSAVLKNFNGVSQTQNSEPSAASSSAAVPQDEDGYALGDKSRMHCANGGDETVELEASGAAYHEEGINSFGGAPEHLSFEIKCESAKVMFSTISAIFDFRRGQQALLVVNYKGACHAYNTPACGGWSARSADASKSTRILCFAWHCLGVLQACGCAQKTTPEASTRRR